LWTPGEDKVLRESYEKLGSDWAAISNLPGRTMSSIVDRKATLGPLLCLPELCPEEVSVVCGKLHGVMTMVLDEGESMDVVLDRKSPDHLVYRRLS